MGRREGKAGSACYRSLSQALSLSFSLSRCGTIHLGCCWTLLLTLLQLLCPRAWLYFSLSLLYIVYYTSSFLQRKNQPSSPTPCFLTSRLFLNSLFLTLFKLTPRLHIPLLSLVCVYPYALLACFFNAYFLNLITITYQRWEMQ